MSRIRPYDDPNREKEPLEQDLLDRALKRVQIAAKGNGLDPATISLTSFEGEVLHFEARSLFEIKHSIGQKFMPGRESRGEICNSEGDLQLKIKDTTEKTTFDAEMIAYVSDIMEKRKDKGFAVNGMPVRLERMNRTLIFHSKCSQCGGDGLVSCGKCNGKGMEPCIKCRGNGMASCPVCKGNRQARGKDGTMGTCIKCNGNGHVRCLPCKGTGNTQCMQCHGKGQIQCTRCNHTGTVSDIRLVSFEAKTHCTFDEEPLPPEVPPIILQMGPNLVIQEHVDIEILRKKEQEEARREHETAEKVKDRDQLTVPYYIRLPWGDIGFKIGDGEEMRGKLFGLHPKILNLPAFLEGPVAPGLESIAQAASGAGNTHGHVMKAIKFRVIGDALVAASTMPVKKAMLAMRKKWPLGFRGETTDSMVLYARDAYNNLSKKPAFAGLAAGLAISAGIMTAYFMSLRYALALHPYAMMALDVVLALGCGYLSLAASQLAVRQALLGVFSKILPPEKARKILPRGIKILPYAYGGALVVMLMVVLGLHLTGHTIPFWAEPVTKLLAPQ